MSAGVTRLDIKFFLCKYLNIGCFQQKNKHILDKILIKLHFCHFQAEYWLHIYTCFVFSHFVFANEGNSSFSRMVHSNNSRLVTTDQCTECLRLLTSCLSPVWLDIYQSYKSSFLLQWPIYDVIGVVKLSLYHLRKTASSPQLPFARFDEDKVIQCTIYLLKI